MPEAVPEDSTTAARPPSNPAPTATATASNEGGQSSLPKTGSVDSVPVDQWLLQRVGSLPRTSLGWFRCGVGFYNRKEYFKSVECFEKAVELDPNNYNAYQIMARACIAINRREDAIAALKQSVNLDNPSDWQLLIELTNQKGAE